jgi:hypothetical protein
MKIVVHKLVPLLACALLSLASTRSGASEDTTSAVSDTNPKIYSIPFQTLAIGARSGVERPAKMLITDEREWQRVWGVHTKPATETPQLPSIDWSRQAVLSLLMGRVSGDAASGNNSSTAPSIELVQVVHTPLDTVVYFREARPAAQNEAVAKTTTDGKTATPNAQPFHFALIDKPSTPLRFVNLSAERCDTCVLGLKQ